MQALLPFPIVLLLTFSFLDNLPVVVLILFPFLVTYFLCLEACKFFPFFSEVLEFLQAFFFNH